MTAEEESALRAEHKRIGDVLWKIDARRQLEAQAALAEKYVGRCYKRPHHPGAAHFTYYAVVGVRRPDTVLTEFDDGPYGVEVRLHSQSIEYQIEHANPAPVEIPREEFNAAWNKMVARVMKMDPHECLPEPPFPGEAETWDYGDAPE